MPTSARRAMKSPGFDGAVANTDGASSLADDVAEEIQVGDNVLAAETVLCELLKKVLAATRCVLDGVHHLIAWPATAFGDGVVVTAAIFDHCHHRPCDVGIEDVSGG